MSMGSRCSNEDHKAVNTDTLIIFTALPRQQMTVMLTFPSSSVTDMLAS